MKLHARRCERCAGTRFLRAGPVVDRAYHERPPQGARAGELRLSWAARAVAYAAPRGAWQIRPALGRFETIICRGCGYTAWYAFDLQAIEGERHQAPCPECDADTPHLSLPSLDRLSWRLVDQSRIMRGARGPEGYLWLWICAPCGRVDWQGSHYHRLAGGTVQACRPRDEPSRPCLRCDEISALSDEERLGARARGRTKAAAPVVPRPSFWMSDYDGSRRRFALRLCPPCGAVEWYARDLAELDANSDGAIEEIGAPLSRVARGGPYR